MKNQFNRLSRLSALALSSSALLAAGTNSQAQPTLEPRAAELKALHGHWEGDGSGGECSITIAGNSLEYRNSAGWYKTTFTLSLDADPQQLHATIKESSPASKRDIGTVVHAIFKVEDDTLLLVTYDNSDKPPESFDDTSNRYSVRKVQSPKKKTEAVPSK